MFLMKRGFFIGVGESVGAGMRGRLAISRLEPGVLAIPGWVPLFAGLEVVLPEYVGTFPSTMSSVVAASFILDRRH